MTNLGALNYFLRMSATQSSQGPSQRNYAYKILERDYMSQYNPARTSAETTYKLDATGPPVADPSMYHNLVQYLTFTCQDISFAAQKICLFTHDTQEPHLHVLKRILRYIQGTLNHSLQLHVSPTTNLHAYSDADWGGCLVSRCSTSGYCIFLDKNLISWSSKRQGVISRSSAGAEYCGITNAIAETCWVHNLLREL